MVGVQGDEEVFYSRGNAGKRIDVYIASTLRDWGSYRWLVVEFHVNGQFVHFLVCGPPNLALTRRYHRFFTGAIISCGTLSPERSIFAFPTKSSTASTSTTMSPIDEALAYIDSLGEEAHINIT